MQYSKVESSQPFLKIELHRPFVKIRSVGRSAVRKRFSWYASVVLVRAALNMASHGLPLLSSTSEKVEKLSNMYGQLCTMDFRKEPFLQTLWRRSLVCSSDFGAASLPLFVSQSPTLRQFMTPHLQESTLVDTCLQYQISTTDFQVNLLYNNSFPDVKMD